MSTRDEDVKNPRLFDRRIVERNIKKGLITRKDYEKHLKALADVAGNIASPEERQHDAEVDAAEDANEAPADDRALS